MMSKFMSHSNESFVPEVVNYYECESFPLLNFK